MKKGNFWTARGGEEREGVAMERNGRLPRCVLCLMLDESPFRKRNRDRALAPRGQEGEGKREPM